MNTINILTSTQTIDGSPNRKQWLWSCVPKLPPAMPCSLLPTVVTPTASPARRVKSYKCRFESGTEVCMCLSLSNACASTGASISINNYSCQELWQLIMIPEALDPLHPRFSDRWVCNQTLQIFYRQLMSCCDSEAAAMPANFTTPDFWIIYKCETEAKIQAQAANVSHQRLAQTQKACAKDHLKNSERLSMHSWMPQTTSWEMPTINSEVFCANPSGKPMPMPQLNPQTPHLLRIQVLFETCKSQTRKCKENLEMPIRNQVQSRLLRKTLEYTVPTYEVLVDRWLSHQSFSWLASIPALPASDKPTLYC